MPPLAPVHKTGRYTAWLREREGERRRPLVEDPYAARLLTDDDRREARALERSGRAADAVVIRHAWLDLRLYRLVTARHARVVVNLGAGLDTRPWRIAWPRDLVWFDVDQQGVLDWKKQRLASEPARCIWRPVTADLHDPAAIRVVAEEAAALATAARASGPVDDGRGPEAPTSAPIFLLEGVLPYLDEAQVRGLLRALREAAPRASLLADVTSSFFVRRFRRQFASALGELGAPLRFWTDEPAAFFASEGWTCTELVPLVEAAIDMGRWPIPRWLPVPRRYRDLASFVLAEAIP